ncbi:MAG: class II aldolase/adducin family protein [Oscillospiraceae bacterium]|nr:class II aldolase/adducin family protein [Oscillospiraceae bacterium]
MDKKIEELISTAKKLKSVGLVTDGVNKGSISCRYDEDSFLISPSKLSYDNLAEDQVNIMRLDGSYARKSAPTSRDSYFHLKIYNARPDVKAIIHTHSQNAVALCLAGRPLPFITYGMKFHCAGSVDMAPFALPNTEECNDLIIKHLGMKKAVLLQNHGLICVEGGLQECYESAEFIESLCGSYLAALQIGEVKEIIVGKEDSYGKI